jgi:NDP-sugar pyrophosphorylase family protein
VDPGARLEGPLFVDEGCVVKAGARLGPYTVLGSNCRVEEGADISGSIVWPESSIGREARLVDTIVGRSGHIGPNASLRGGVLGDNSHIAEHSRL